TMADPMPDPPPIALSSGMFGTFDPVHSGTGTATIYELAPDVRVLRLEDFRVNNGPDLYVWLTSNVPTNITAPVGDFVDLGPLRGNVGNQNYDIPADVDLDVYNAVVIYCLPFRINFTVAELR
ncbi:MAG: DM13 domain-containing protein, partial [Anaerolineales bacterium]